MEFEKKGQNHGKIIEFQNTSGKNHGIVFSDIFSHASFEIVSQATHDIGHFHSIQIMENSWKNHEIPFCEMAGNPATELWCHLISDCI